MAAISPLIGQGPHIPPSVIKTGVKLPQLQPQPGHHAPDKVTGAKTRDTCLTLHKYLRVYCCLNNGNYCTIHIFSCL